MLVQTMMSIDDNNNTTKSVSVLDDCWITNWQVSNPVWSFDHAEADLAVDWRVRKPKKVCGL